MAVPAMAPIQPAAPTSFGGTMSATGRPNRVTRRGRPEVLTRSRAAKHVALNLDIAMVFIIAILLWSKSMVNLGETTDNCVGRGDGALDLLKSSRSGAFGDVLPAWAASLVFERSYSERKLVAIADPCCLRAQRDERTQ